MPSIIKPEHSQLKLHFEKVDDPKQQHTNFVKKWDFKLGNEEYEIKVYKKSDPTKTQLKLSTDSFEQLADRVDELYKKLKTETESSSKFDLAQVSKYEIEMKRDSTSPVPKPAIPEYATQKFTMFDEKQHEIKLDTVIPTEANRNKFVSECNQAKIRLVFPAEGKAKAQPSAPRLNPPVIDAGSKDNNCGPFSILHQFIQMTIIRPLKETDFEQEKEEAAQHLRTQAANKIRKHVLSLKLGPNNVYNKANADPFTNIILADVKFAGDHGELGKEEQIYKGVNKILDQNDLSHKNIIWLANLLSNEIERSNCFLGNAFFYALSHLSEHDISERKDGNLLSASYLQHLIENKYHIVIVRENEDTGKYVSHEHFSLEDDVTSINKENTLLIWYNGTLKKDGNHYQSFNRTDGNFDNIFNEVKDSIIAPSNKSTPIAKQQPATLIEFNENDGNHDFLTNDYPCEVTIFGHTFVNAHVAYAAARFISIDIISMDSMKATSEGGKAALTELANLEATDPDLNKKVAEIVQNYNKFESEDWEIKFAKAILLRQVLLAKFKNENLKQKLLDTRDIALKYSPAKGNDLSQENLLGKTLEKVRFELSVSKKPPVDTNIVDVSSEDDISEESKTASSSPLPSGSYTKSSSILIDVGDPDNMFEQSERFLSTAYPYEIRVFDHTFYNANVAYEAAKFTSSKGWKGRNKEECKEILTKFSRLKGPDIDGKARKLALENSTFANPHWEKEGHTAHNSAHGKMKEILEAKFAEGSDLEKQLLATAPANLEAFEENPYWDNNKLGLLLQAIRSEKLEKIEKELKDEEELEGIENL